jgi:C4-dicarboxylate-specific signal transduction histidine kinase
VAIDVADTGRSLGIELLAQLFKPFVKRRKDGTGLGLWISRSITERYGGALVRGGPRRRHAGRGIHDEAEGGGPGIAATAAPLQRGVHAI